MNNVKLGGIGIEIVRGCNFACRMCPSTKAIGPHMSYMSLDTAKMVVERINACDSIASIWAFGMGEPLAHPEYYRLTECLNQIKRSTDTPVILHTNASLLKGEAAYALLDIPFVTQLNISFDGYGDEFSYTYLRGNHFYEVIDRVRDFTILARRKRPGLFISTCSIYPEAQYMPEEATVVSKEEAEKCLKSIFEPMGVHVAMRELHHYNGFYTPELYQDHAVIQHKVLGGCGYLEEISFEIAHDGTVRPCRDVVNTQFMIGDLNKNTFKEIVSCEKFLNLRHNLRLDKRYLYPECKNCDKYSFGDDYEGMKAYWIKKLENGEVTDAEEKAYIQSICELNEHILSQKM